MVDDGTDCDGRLTRCSESYCTLDRLAVREPPQEYAENVGIRTPEWERGPAYQRDWAAEACGY
jgi:hypothetical protein